MPYDKLYYQKRRAHIIKKAAAWRIENTDRAKTTAALRYTVVRKKRIKQTRAWAVANPEAKILAGARTRCTNSRCTSWPYYGQRRIKCLIKNVKELIALIGARPSTKHSIDRIDNNGNYEAGNVRLATQKQQRKNQTIVNQTGFCRGPKCSI